MKIHRRKFLSPTQKIAVIQRQNWLCACGCGEPLGEDPRDIEFDHALDLQFGGTNDMENFRALKRKHHLAKTNKAAKARAKVERIRARGGMHRKKMNEAEKQFAKMLEGRT